MVEGKHKSRKKAKIFVRTPGSKVAIHYKKRKPRQARCANCHKILFGTPKLLQSKLKNLSASSKKPKRAFGGNMCSACSRLEIINRARLKYL